ncbi:hypothetical protein [Haloarcula nitratireducens]|uniref:Cell surface glycoprotein n=1 Tax=Haloarcula nitratireducens TaxID=2487749 RepID=A0AAW4PKQ2_9EURY|nr:hypothetical protein [Halomicroarcula nitratireducens]MBX0297792.1 hypothetical protein [Halomicroarcula nitratireducens]
MTRLRSRYLLLVIIGALLLVPAASAVSGYDLSGEPSIETPSRTVEYDGLEYTVDSISRIHVDESVTVAADVPSGTNYNLNLRGPDNELIISERKSEDTTQTLSYFGAGEAGTYAATIQSDGNTLAVHPIVLAGYNVTVSGPESAETGDTATFEARVSDLKVEKHSSLESVEIVVGDDETYITQQMTKQGGTYTATVSTDKFEPGTYNVYAVVQGDKKVRQRAEILGVSDSSEITVTGSTQSTTAGGGDSGGAESTPSTQTASPTADSPATDGTTGTESAGTTSPPTETSTESGSATETATDETGVIDPSTQTSTTTTAGNGPGFTAGGSLVAILLSLYFVRRAT